MKTILTVCLLAFTCFAARADKQETLCSTAHSALYYEEFLGKLIAGPVKIDPSVPVQIEVARLVEETGLAKVLKNAEDAKDDLTQTGYFLIVRSEESVSIEKRYTLARGYILLSLSLSKDASGKLIAAGLTRGFTIKYPPGSVLDE